MVRLTGRIPGLRFAGPDKTLTASLRKQRYKTTSRSPVRISKKNGKRK